MDAAERRREQALKRKAEQVAAAEAKKAAKAAEAEALRAERAFQKAASEAAKARQKEALASQALYQSLFGAHAQLVRDMAPVPCDKHDCEKYEAAQELAAKGEGMIDDALGAMREKSELDKAGIAAFIKDQKRVSKEMGVLATKKKRGRDELTRTSPHLSLGRPRCGALRLGMARILSVSLFFCGEVSLHFSVGDRLELICKGVSIKC